jgi:hypothetical protein
MRLNMAIFQWLKKLIITTEQDVVAIVIKAKHDGDLTAREINKALRWIVNNTPALEADIKMITNVVCIVNPSAGVALKVANAAITDLNVLAAAYKNGNGNAASVVDGYLTLKRAQSANANGMTHLSPLPADTKSS